MTKQETKKQAWYKTPGGIIGIIAMSVFGLPIVIGITLAAIASTSDIQQRTNPTQEVEVQDNSAKARYEINVAGNSYAGPSQRRVTFTVKNIGDAPGNPSCSIIVDSAENTSKYYHGTDYAYWNTPLNPGDSKYFEGLITISDEGAAYATRAKVNC